MEVVSGGVDFVGSMNPDLSAGHGVPVHHPPTAPTAEVHQVSLTAFKEPEVVGERVPEHVGTDVSDARCLGPTVHDGPDAVVAQSPTMAQEQTRRIRVAGASS